MERLSRSVGAERARFPAPAPPAGAERDAFLALTPPAGAERAWFLARLPRLERTGLDESSLLDRLAERVELEAQFLGDLFSAPTGAQQLLRLGSDLRRHHRSAACRASRVERCHAAGAILGDAANDAVLRDAKGPHDIHQAARTLADQLGGKHLKGAVVVLGVLKHRLNAAEVCPLAIFTHNADDVVDAIGTVGDQR